MKHDQGKPVRKHLPVVSQRPLCRRRSAAVAAFGT